VTSSIKSLVTVIINCSNNVNAERIDYLIWVSTFGARLVPILSSNKYDEGHLEKFIRKIDIESADGGLHI